MMGSSITDIGTEDISEWTLKNTNTTGEHTYPHRIKMDILDTNQERDRGTPCERREVQGSAKCLLAFIIDSTEIILGKLYSYLWHTMASETMPT